MKKSRVVFVGVLVSSALHGMIVFKDVSDKKFCQLSLVCPQQHGLNQLYPRAEQNILSVSSLYPAYLCESLDEGARDAAQTINTFAHVNKFLNKLINNQENTLVLIKWLSQKFNGVDRDNAFILRTKGANKRLFLQQAFFVEATYRCRFMGNCFSRGFFMWHIKTILDRQKQQGLAVDFTYDKDFSTALLNLIACPESYPLYDIEWLIENGADITVREPRSQSNALMLAVGRLDKCALEITNLLLQNSIKFDSNYQNSNGDTALHYCLQSFKYKISQRKVCECNRQSPLMSFEDGFPVVSALIERLLEEGANPWITNYRGKTPVDLAHDFKDQRLINLLKDMCIDFLEENNE